MSSNWTSQQQLTPYTRDPRGQAGYGPPNQYIPDLDYAPPLTQEEQRHGIIGFWLNLTAPPRPSGFLPIQQRERQRKAELTSYIIFAVFLFLIALVSNSLASPTTAQAVATMAAGLCIAALLNRFGFTRTAAFFVPALLTLLIMFSLIGAPGLQLIGLPIYDLLTIPIFVSSFNAGRWAPWIFATISIAFILIDFNLEPHALITATTAQGLAKNFDDIANEVRIYGVWGTINRPISLCFFAAFFGFLFSRSVDDEIRRADRAEEIAALEHRVAEQRRQLEEGIQQILATHVRIANGDYNARAPLSQDNALWQIASSLNNLVSRFRTIGEQTNRVGYQLQRTEEEVHRLAVALRDLQGGRRPIWPAPSRTAVDELLPILAGRDRKQPTLPPAASWDGGPSGGQFGQGGSGQPQHPGESAYGWPSPASPAAPTPPPISGGGWVHNPPRFGPPLTDGFRQSPSSPRPDMAGATGPMPQMPPSPMSPFPPQQAPNSAPRSFEEGWPSLDGHAMESPEWGAGESNDGQSGAAPGEDPFQPLDNPWYLPPDE